MKIARKVRIVTSIEQQRDDFGIAKMCSFMETSVVFVRPLINEESDGLIVSSESGVEERRLSRGVLWRWFCSQLKEPFEDLVSAEFGCETDRCNPLFSRKARSCF
jgi:hypothetical protein